MAIGGHQEGREVDVLLEVGRLVPGGREGDRQEEGEEDLHAGDGDADLLEQLHELAVEALGLGLLAVGDRS